MTHRTRVCERRLSRDRPRETSVLVDVVVVDADVEKEGKEEDSKEASQSWKADEGAVMEDVCEYDGVGS